MGAVCVQVFSFSTLTYAQSCLVYTHYAISTSKTGTWQWGGRGGGVAPRCRYPAADEVHNTTRGSTGPSHPLFREAYVSIYFQARLAEITPRR